MVEPWERLLWKHQQFKDNHVPQSFLEVLQDSKFNPSRPLPSFGVFRIGFSICQQISLLWILEECQWNELVIPSVVSFAAEVLMGNWDMPDGDYRRFLVPVYFLATAIALTLKPSSFNVSIGSFWAPIITHGLNFYYLSLVDYSNRPNVTQHRASSSRLLAVLAFHSMLPNKTSASCRILCGGCLMLPNYRRRIALRSFVAHAACTSFVVIVSSTLLRWNVPYLCTAVVTSVVFPGAFVWAQRFKRSTHGPWDIQKFPSSNVSRQ
jgi:hypothetical protein